jgi:methionine aminopeptidase
MIILKTPDEIALMAKASRVVAEALEVLKSAAKPGVTTDELDRLAEAEIRSRGAVPAFKGYRNYPKTLCASVNEQVVHGIPSKRVLKDGDIVGLDLGAIVGGFYGDSAVTIAVGRIDEKAATGDSAGAGWEPAVRYFSCGSAACRSGRLFGCHRVCRTRDRAPATRGAAGTELREAGAGSSAPAGHGIGD